jgi:long-chain acyl-CoA synthetase
MSKNFQSLAELILWRCSETPRLDAFYSPDGDDWRTWSWDEVGKRTRNIAAGLRAMGVQDEERVGVLCTTRVEWILCDLGILVGGGATTTIYPSNTPEECQYILDDSGTVAVFAENDDQVKKLVEVRDQLPNLRVVINVDGHSGHDGWVITLAELEQKGAAWMEAEANDLDAVVKRITPDRLATLIYTSGTTGKPKGVELLHDCWLYTGGAMHDLGFLTSEDKQFLWLPMSHSFGKVLETAVIRTGIPTAIDGRIPKIVENLAVLKPTFMAAAPRIFEKVYNKVVMGAKEGGAVKYGIFRWALAVGRDVSRERQAGREPSGMLALKSAIADRLVFGKLRALFGGNIRFFISGSAPLSLEMAEFFHATGMLILEGYGLTESSAASFVNRPSAFEFGTVGLPLPGTEVKLDPADGEILMRGRGIMRGYYHLAETTAETLEDGWLRTGDIGEINDRGMLKITDRKKDLIKTSGGKYVAPQHLEGKLKALCPYLGQVLVHGNNRNYCTALVTVDEESITKWAADNGHADLDYEQLTKHDDVKSMIQPAVDALNAEMPSYSTIKKFAILPKDFTVEDGELTPSLKMKRKVIEQRYDNVLDGFYQGALAAV